MLKAQWVPYTLHFHFVARTSRETMRTKSSYFIRIFDSEAPERTLATGECALFRGLSADDMPDYETKLSEACMAPEKACLSEYSSIRFGFESAFASLDRRGDGSDWVRGTVGIPINGLVWMGDKETMRRRIADKLEAGFKVLKLKIGGIDFEDEKELLRMVRASFSPSDLEIRLDANGSFHPDNALRMLSELAEFGIHSIEQPVRAGLTETMALLCSKTPIPIALDEELIGVRDEAASRTLLDNIRPQYIILKPSLCGGFAGADTYIRLAQETGIGWWATSALESNIGLEAIARWLTAYSPVIPQGLGTGQLYTDNIESPLHMDGPALFYNPAAPHGSIDNLSWRQ